MSELGSQTAGPFFLLGAPRSGTTMLRNLLRTHPGLAAPEETHFYRWSSAFKSYFYESQYATNTLVEHRRLDGISDESFWEMYAASGTRFELQEQYMKRFVAVNKPGAQWFDKTPQNSFGVSLLRSDYPTAPLIHLVRHPFPVVASLLRGDAIEVTNLDEAIAHWHEPVRTMLTIADREPDVVLTVQYADLIAEPSRTLSTICERVGIDAALVDVSAAALRTTDRDWSDVVDAPAAAAILDRCAAEIDALQLLQPEV